MTVKERLYEFIREMTDEDAAELLAQIEWDATEEEELTPEELELVRQGLRDYEDGKTVPAAEVYRELGL